MLLENASAVEYEREEKRMRRREENEEKRERKSKDRRGESRDGCGMLMRCVCTTSPRRVRTN